MHKRIIITLLIIFTPMAFIEQNKKHQNSSLKNEKVDMFHIFDQNNFEIKNCWEERYLLSQKYIAYLQKNLFYVYQ